jgi:hypothetical protein
MARSFNGSSQYLSVSSALFSSPPLSISGWVNADDLTNAHTAFCIGHTTNNQPFIILQCSGTVGGDPFRLIIRDNAGNLQTAITTTGYSVSTWHHILGVWASATSTAIYIDGGSKGTDTDPTLGTLTVNRTAIGVRWTSSLQQYFAGKEAEFGLWDVALTDAEAQVLALGVPPRFVRPSNFVDYWRIMGRTSPEIDQIGGNDMSLTANPPVADHPPMMSRPPVYVGTPEAAAAALVGPFPTFLRVP